LVEVLERNIRERILERFSSERVVQATASELLGLVQRL
jgi:hypothetical protein